MMKTSSSSLLSYKRAFPLFAMILVPFGPLENLLQEKSRYRGFHAEDPVLKVIDIQKNKFENLAACQIEMKKLKLYHPGVPPERMTQAFFPWTTEDTEAVEKCASFPCDIKLNAKENARVAALPAEKRRSEWEKVIGDRMALYLSNGTRQSYLYPGDPMDPWHTFTQMGLSVPELKQGKPNLLVRRLKFSAGKMRPLRQVLDLRSEVTTHSVKVWVRDVYTDHYFDSWGEWHQADCEKDGTLTLIQSLVVDFDLLRKTDIISSLAKGKMRSAIEKGGHQYLSEILEKLKMKSIKKPK